MHTLTVIMPAYNEQEAIEAAVREVRESVLDVVPNSSLLVVNDGSKDKTGEILDRLVAADARVQVVHKKNGGHGPALLTGLSSANAECYMLVDSDLQIPMNAFGPLWNAVRNGADAAFGMRVKRDDPRLRLWLTKFIRASLPILLGVSIRDANVPFKLFKRNVWETVSPLIPSDTLAPSLFLAVFIKKMNYKLELFEVPHKERQTGEVSIKRWKLIKFCWRALKQLLSFRSRLSTWMKQSGK
jgi:glycosyltransferase involved in cell wall biosynthesis